MNLPLAFLLCAALTGLEYHENFLANPSFETDADRDLQPDGWQGNSFESPGRFVWDHDRAHSGNSSLGLSDPGTAEPGNWQAHAVRWSSREMPIEPGTDYTLEVWVKARDVSGRARVRIAWQARGSWLSEVASDPLSGTSDWTRLTVSGTAPQNAETARVILELADGSGTAWFDDAKLSGKGELPPQVTYVFNDTRDWFPFEIPRDDTNRDTIDLSGLLHAPAGQHGFVTVGPDGHLRFEDGTSARFFGVDIGGGNAAPDKEFAPILAERLAKYGINMVRLHAMDAFYGPLIDYSRGDSRHFDPEGLDRIDYFVAQLKKHGVYVYMDLLDYRLFRSGDGVAHADDFTHNWQGSMKGASIFDERMIELQEEYAEKLFSHRNPYTGLRYADDPAVALVEITNENSVFYFLNMDGLSLPYYREQLVARWNRWLLEKYGSREKLAEAWTGDSGRSELLAGDESQEAEDPSRGTVAFPFATLWRQSRQGYDDPIGSRVGPRRMADVLEMLGQIQARYYQRMRACLERVGVRVPISGTNQFFQVADRVVNAKYNDLFSQNQYWRHPNLHAKPFFRFSNEPMLTADVVAERTPLSICAASSVVGKPLVVSEFNFPWPNEYRCEGIITMAAYARLQGWDGLLVHAYASDSNLIDFFRFQSDPARWGQIPAAALLFHRGDVRQAQNEIHVIRGPAEMTIYEPDERQAAFSIFRDLVFVSRVQQAFVHRSYDGEADLALACGPSAGVPASGGTPILRLEQSYWQSRLFPEIVGEAKRLGLSGYETINPDEKRFSSDTGELCLDYHRGLLVIDTARTKAAVGLLSDQGSIALGDVQLECDTPFAAIILTALDDRPIGDSRRLLLTCTARAENTAQGFWPPSEEEAQRNTYAWRLPGRGREPVICEPVRARLRLPASGKLTVFALDPTGRRRSQPAGISGVEQKESTLTIDTGKAETVWLEILVR